MNFRTLRERSRLIAMILYTKHIYRTMALMRSPGVFAPRDLAWLDSYSAGPSTCMRHELQPSWFSALVPTHDLHEEVAATI
jgi:hypothetical protein